MDEICGGSGPGKNWAGVTFTKKKGLGTTPGDTYNGGMCECGHSGMAHHAQGHFGYGSWQCWNGQWVKPTKKPYQFLLTALPCGWHQFKAIKSGE